MAKATVYNVQGEKTGEIDLSDAIFSIKPNNDLLYQVITAERSNARNTVSHTKTRGEVSGSGRKPWKQKGTGNARAGSIRSPIWRHGGVTFGPRSSRNYSKKVNRKMFRKAVCMVLTDKFAEKNFFVLDSLPVTHIKTKDFAAMIRGFSDKMQIKPAAKLAIIVPKAENPLKKSAANLPYVNVLNLNEVSPFRLLSSGAAIFTRDALSALESIYKK